MRDRVRTPSYYLCQLKKDNAELLQKYAELAILRGFIRQKEEVLRAKRVHRERLTSMLPTSGETYGHRCRAVR